MLADDPAGYATYKPGAKPAVPKPFVYQPTNPGWGANPAYAVPGTPWSPNVANNMSQFGYDVPGTAANPSPPMVGVNPKPEQAPWDPNQAIADSWEVANANAAANQMNSAAREAFQKALRQAYIDYGGAGENLGDWAQYIDQATIDAAKANKYSALAMNKANYEKQTAQSQAELAARGMLSSGDTVTSMKDLLFNREGADYGALRNFNVGAYGGLKELAQIKQQAEEKISAAGGVAAERVGEDAPVSDEAAATASSAAASAGNYTWDESVTNIAQLKDWLKARGKSLAQFKIQYPAAYAKLAAQ